MSIWRYMGVKLSTWYILSPLFLLKEKQWSCASGGGGGGVAEASNVQFYANVAPH
jgi:hypothetical protein